MIDRTDVKWTDTNFDIKTYHNYNQTYDDTLPTILDIIRLLDLPQLSQNVTLAMQELLLIDSHVDQEVFDLVSKIRSDHENSIFIPIDKDIKRRCVMSRDAYLYRLGHCYATDPGHYTIVGPANIEKMTYRRKQMINKYIPKKHRETDYEKLSIFPTCYQLTKESASSSLPGH